MPTTFCVGPSLASKCLRWDRGSVRSIEKRVYFSIDLLSDDLVDVSCTDAVVRRYFGGNPGFRPQLRIRMLFPQGFRLSLPRGVQRGDGQSQIFDVAFGVGTANDVLHLGMVNRQSLADGPLN